MKREDIQYDQRVRVNVPGIMGMWGQSSACAAAPARSIWIAINRRGTWSSSLPAISIALLTNDRSAWQLLTLIPRTEHRRNGYLNLGRNACSERY